MPDYLLSFLLKSYALYINLGLKGGGAPAPPPPSKSATATLADDSLGVKHE